MCLCVANVYNIILYKYCAVQFSYGTPLLFKSIAAILAGIVFESTQHKNNMSHLWTERLGSYKNMVHIIANKDGKWSCTRTGHVQSNTSIRRRFLHSHKTKLPPVIARVPVLDGLSYRVFITLTFKRDWLFVAWQIVHHQQIRFVVWSCDMLRRSVRQSRSIFMLSRWKSSVTLCTIIVK